MHFDNRLRIKLHFHHCRLLFPFHPQVAERPSVESRENVAESFPRNPRNPLLKKRPRIPSVSPRQPNYQFSTINYQLAPPRQPNFETKFDEVNFEL